MFLGLKNNVGVYETHFWTATRGGAAAPLHLWVGGKGLVMEPEHTGSGGLKIPGQGQEPLVASLLLVVRRPGAPSSVLVPSSDPYQTILTFLLDDVAIRAPCRQRGVFRGTPSSSAPNASTHVARSPTGGTSELQRVT